MENLQYAPPEEARAQIKKYTDIFQAAEEKETSHAIKNADAAEFLFENAPWFWCDDASVEETYYFRLWVYRKHIRKTPEGFVVTEFLPETAWSGKYNAISCPVQHHIAEGAWFRDHTFLKEYIRHFAQNGGNDADILSYTNAFVGAVSDYCLARNDKAFARELLPSLRRIQDRLEEKHITKYGLYWSDDDRDGMEFSVSGRGLRITVNSYMYGGYMGLAALCDMLDMPGTGEEYRKKAEQLKEKVTAHLWDESTGFYKTVPMDDPKGEADLLRENADRNVMEEIGFLPWYYGLDALGTDKAWRRLTDEKHFKAPFGPTTADISHRRFMASTNPHPCLWDGPSWPFSTAQTLSALGTYLLRGESPYISPADFMSLLDTYTKSQYLKREDGTKINWIDENLHPFTGEWLARSIFIERNCPQPDRAPDRGRYYNHSTYADIVLRYAAGIRLLPFGISVTPLATSVWEHFYVGNLLHLGRTFAVSYEKDAGLTIFVDGKAVAHGKQKAVYCIE